MRVWTVACLVVALVLAGCSGDPKPSSTDGAPEPEFDVEATDTTGVIRGIVVDTAIRPLAGVLVNLTTGPSMTTGDDGAFGFEGLEPGTYFIHAAKPGFSSTQASTDVVAGVDAPEMLKVQLIPDPVQQPYIESYSFQGFLNFGASVGITSLGSTFLGGLPNDYAIWNIVPDQVPWYAQGELVWEQTQPAGGMLIWEMVKGGTNDWRGHRETNVSPALAYWNYTVLQSEAGNVTEQGIDYRFFGGPHPLLAPANSGGTIIPPEDDPKCPWVNTVVLGNRNWCRFGFGLTVNQRADGYVHQFYNFLPPEGWRFTTDGDPVVPDEPGTPPA